MHKWPTLSQFRGLNICWSAFLSYNKSKIISRQKKCQTVGRVAYQGLKCCLWNKGEAGSNPTVPNNLKDQNFRAWENSEGESLRTIYHLSLALNPTNFFTILEPWKPSIAVSELNKVNLFQDFEAMKLSKYVYCVHNFPETFARRKGCRILIFSARTCKGFTSAGLSTIVLGSTFLNCIKNHQLQISRIYNCKMCGQVISIYIFMAFRTNKLKGQCQQLLSAKYALIQSKETTLERAAI